MIRQSIEICCYVNLDNANISPLFDEYSLGRYCSDWTLDIIASRRLEHDRLIDYLQQNGDSSWLAIHNERPVGILGIRKSEWDTNFWGINYANIDYLYVCNQVMGEKATILGQLLNKANQWFIDEKIDFASTRVDSIDIDAIQSLEKQGFRYIETTVINSFDLKKLVTPPQFTGEIRYAHPDEEDELIDMVEDGFLSHRFYADKRFPKSQVDSMYRNWVINSLISSHWATIVLEAQNQLRGFFIYSVEDLSDYFKKKFVRWRLAAVRDKDRGGGFGDSLFNGAMQFVRDEAEIVDSGLTIRNIRSFNLHNKLGFRIINSSITLHKWMR
jgi:GNAT superfamily N-acetyltransferase